MDFFRGGNYGEISSYQLKTNRKIFSCKNMNRKIQARNQLGTPGEAKSFLRGAQIF